MTRQLAFLAAQHVARRQGARVDHSGQYHAENQRAGSEEGQRRADPGHQSQRERQLHHPAGRHGHRVENAVLDAGRVGGKTRGEIADSGGTKELDRLGLQLDKKVVAQVVQYLETELGP